ncbi:Bug family tripartite tricarboxylate transporter substrate binding protein [Cupriavidus sp. 2TAF22]|uniref:Bug family tripartite tricarboxylate transporter substrate binding protein n=1 Tax=unclassified Cupriavidus TaxID=2640874 RepID=UPI003F91D8E0
MKPFPAALHLARAALALAASCAFGASAAAPECIVPAKPGGGFDLTCKLAQRALLEAGMTGQPMRLAYMPGGIGAVAYNSVVAQRPAEPDTIVAFSSGSLLALAEGKFGKYGAADVRWVGALATDYGVVAVRADSPYKTLKDLVAALRSDPDQVLFGAGGTIGNQDWMKAALLARQAGVGYKRMRFVGFEGGGEAFTALRAGQVQAVSGDASEATMQLAMGDIRILAVLAERRLPGTLAAVPTAREQGYDIDWPVVRGFYMGPKVAQADYARWAARFERLQASPAFARLRAEQGLYPADMDAAALDAYVKRTVQRYGTLAKEFGLVR